MKVHVSKDIIIGYVFGGDNAPFIKAFEDTESIAICVSRNHERESFINKENLKNYNYIYIKDNPYSNISSTKIRNKQIKIKQEKEKSNNFLIRNDYNMFNFPKEDSPLEEFKKLFKKSLTNSNIYDICVEDQYISAENLKKYDKNKKISLDVYVKGDYNISLSRLFNHSDSQIKASSLVSRPEEESIDFKLLPSGDYTLVEDDVVSGFTLKHLKSKLPKNVILKDLIILSKLSKVNTDFYDVVDLRDFIIGTNFSGLVVDIYGTHVRVPYMYPYVDLTTRASIKPEYALKFTKEMLNINIKFYKKLKEKNIEVSSNKSIIFLMDLIGIKKNISNIDNIINFCEWHLDKIKKVTRT